MWTKQFTVTRQSDADIAACQLFRDNVLVKEVPWPRGPEYPDGCALSLELTDETPDDADYTWTARLKDEAGNAEFYSAPITERLDHTAPIVALGALPAQVPDNEGFTVTASATDNLNPVTEMRMELNHAAFGAVVAGASASWDVNASDLPPGVHEIAVFAKDAQGLEGEQRGTVEVTQLAADITVLARPGLILEVNGQRIVT
jgi:hypothetical protein